LKGHAKAIHIAKMAYDNKLMRQMLEQFMDSVDERLEALLDRADAKAHPRIHSVTQSHNRVSNVRNSIASQSSHPGVLLGSNHLGRI